MPALIFCFALALVGYMEQVLITFYSWLRCLISCGKNGARNECIYAMDLNAK